MLYAVPAVATGFPAILAISAGLNLFVSSGTVDAYTLDVLGPKENKTRYGEVRLWLAVSWGLGTGAMSMSTWPAVVPMPQTNSQRITPSAQTSAL